MVVFVVLWRSLSFQQSQQIAILRFGKFKRRMARLTIEADVFRKDRDKAFSIRVLRAWQGDARGRGSARKKIVGMGKRRAKRVRMRVGRKYEKLAAVATLKNQPTFVRPVPLLTLQTHTDFGFICFDRRRSSSNKPMFQRR